MTKSPYQKHRKLEQIMADMKSNSLEIKNEFAVKLIDENSIKLRDLRVQILKEKAKALHWEYRASKEHQSVLNCHNLMCNYHTASDEKWNNIIKKLDEILEIFNKFENSVMDNL